MKPKNQIMNLKRNVKKINPNDKSKWRWEIEDRWASLFKNSDKKLKGTLALEAKRKVDLEFDSKKQFKKLIEVIKEI